MGLKAESKQLMEKAGVPLVPGYHGADQDPELLQREADRIGYPVLDQGQRRRRRQGHAPGREARGLRRRAGQSCKREAINSFGDDAVLVEKYVLRPRHIEIQVFGDTQGNCVYLFERDCSVQRRHQKVLEEAPAPGMTPELRAADGRGRRGRRPRRGLRGRGHGGVHRRAARRLRRAEMQFYFMEMNTRLQVEHPVTEAITGQDLVEWQLRVAAGQPLP